MHRSLRSSRQNGFAGKQQHWGYDQVLRWICEPKPYGRNQGEYWDLSKESDIAELKQMVQYEKPWFLTGSPPCTAFSALQNIGRHKRDPHKVVQERKHAEKLLEVAISFYDLQRDQGRFFLHEHLHGCESWSHPLMVELQRKPGVFTSHPLCVAGRHAYQETRIPLSTTHQVGDQQASSSLRHWIKSVPTNAWAP